MHPVKLVERATSTAVHTLRHPVASVAYAAGMARGFAGAAVHAVAGASGRGPRTSPGEVPTQRESATTSTSTLPRRPQRVAKPVPDPADLPEPVVIEGDDEPAEEFATEPKATSRDSAHGGPGNDAEIDEWMAEAADDSGIDVETPVGTTGADAGFNPDTAEADLQQPGTEPLLDPGTAKAIRSESEMLRKDAEREPE